jgi:aerobic-type carbon monoxide dehydrogenase small subunit (CoxS/CutS family)
MHRKHDLNVNGSALAVTTDPDRPLLDVLREDLGLTGTKYGCGEGECGACTVLIDGRAVRSCVTPVGHVAAARIQTIEGLANGDVLHPVQQAFVDRQAMQCGYCIPGQILAAVDLLGQKKNPSREEVIESMTRNICRCCNYDRILAAVEHASELMGAGDRKGDAP